MNANLRQFQAFVTVARLGSFTRAAKHLHLSQPALTVQIRKLEEAMGVRLFDRSTRVVMLTPIGRELAPTLGGCSMKSTPSWSIPGNWRLT